MNDKVHDGYNECCVNKRRNAVNYNASLEKVNVITEDGKDPEDERVHDENPMPSVRTMIGPRTSVRTGFKSPFNSARISAISASWIQFAV